MIKYNKGFYNVLNEKQKKYSGLCLFLVVYSSFYTGCHNAWIGLEDFLANNNFVWEGTQEVPEYTNWKPNEPNGLHQNETALK